MAPQSLPMNASPRILILTAAFGEGHNSAARNIHLAAQSRGILSKVADPCLLSAPHATHVIQWAYRLVTTHFPKLWEKIYRSTDQCDFSKESLPLMRQPENYLSNLIADYSPTHIVSTYPIYPYFLKRIFAETTHRIPVYTVVTDSIEINASWLRAPTDHFLVTDQLTLETMRCWGIPEEKLIYTGFPVHPSFASRSNLLPNDSCSPFRVLYFATAKKPFIRRHGRAILKSSPETILTIVLGKNFRSLYSRAKELRNEFPGRVKILGWTSKVPALLSSHHLAVGKAGGATVHEAIASHCPMLIHHLVPGQEEGNLTLLQQIGAGDLSTTPEDLTHAIQAMLPDDAARWRKMKRALIAHDRNNGAQRAVEFIISNSSQKTDAS